MNRRAIIALVLLCLLSVSQTACTLGRPAAEVPCHNDAVQTSPGVILPLASGQTYQVYPTDNTISMMWLPLDKLTVCPLGGAAVEITNLSRKAEKVRAVRIFNPGWYVWPLNN
jgi:hypothetical protein